MLSDVRGLEQDEIVETLRWAAQALVSTAMGVARSATPPLEQPLP